jgi:hypothetical protein
MFAIQKAFGGRGEHRRIRRISENPPIERKRGYFFAKKQCTNYTCHMFIYNMSCMGIRDEIQQKKE